MDKSNSVEQRILTAAIGCIEKYGPEGATIRRIAQDAGVNSAAISYYFRSKDKLIEKAMEMSLANGFDWDDYTSHKDESPKQKVVRILIKLVEGAYTYPGLTRAHFFDVFTKQDYSTPAVAKINEFFGRVLNELKTNMKADEKELSMALTQIAASAFLLPALMPGLFKGFSGIDLNDREELKRYIEKSVDCLL